MSNQLSQEDIEKNLSKIIQAGKEKQKISLTNEFLARLERHKNDIKRIKWDFLFGKEDYKQNKILLLKVVNKLMELGVYRDNFPFSSLVLNYCFELSGKLETKFQLDFIDNIIYVCGEIQKEFVIPVLDFLLFEFVIKDQNYQNIKVFSMITNILKKHKNSIIKYKIDIIVETCILSGFYLIRPQSDNKILSKDTQVIIAQICSIFQFYLVSYSGTKKNDTLLKIMSFLMFDFDNEKMFLLNFFDNSPNLMLRLIFEFLLITPKEIVEYIDFYSLEVTPSFCFFCFDATDDLYNQKREEINEMKCKSLNDFINEKRAFLKQKFNNEVIITRTIELLKLIWDKPIYIDIIPTMQIIEKLDLLIIKEYINKKYIYEILNSILSLINKKGKTLFEEWTFIFRILEKVYIYGKEYKAQNDLKKKELKSLFEKIEAILISINRLYLFDSFKGNIQDLSKFLQLNTHITNEWVSILKCNLSLFTQKDFLANIEGVVNNILLSKIDSYSTPTLRNYVLEIIRYNYQYSTQVDENIEGKETICLKIEDIFIKSFHAIINSETENLVFLSYVICEILYYTKNEDFFEKIIKMLFTVLSFDLEKEDHYKIFKILIVDSLKALLMRLNNDFQKQKILFLKKFLFHKSQLINNIKIRTAVKLAKNITISKDYFIQFSYNESFKNTYPKYPCQIILNYKRNIIKEYQQKCKNKEEYKSYKENFYFPYIGFNFSRIYNKVVELIQNKNTISVFFLQDLYEFIDNTYKNPILIQMVDYKKFVMNLLEKKLFSEPLYQRPKIRKNIFNILINSTCYSLSPLNQNINKNQQIEQDLMYNSLKTLTDTWSSLQGIVSKYTITKYQMYSPRINVENVFNEMGIDQKNNKDEILKIKSTIIDIVNIIKILKFYLFSLTNMFDMKKHRKKNQDPKSQFFIYRSNQLTIFIMNVIESLTQIFLFTYFYQSLGYAIVSFFYETKDILTNFDDKLIMKILILLLLILNRDQEEIVINSFRKMNFDLTNIENDIHRREVIKLFIKDTHTPKTDAKIQVLEFFSRITCLYYMEHLECPDIFYEIIKEIVDKSNKFPKKSTKSSLFLDLCKWYLFSGNNRDNYIPLLQTFTDQDIDKMQIYLLERNIIIIHPISLEQCCISIRSSIANISLTIENFDKEKFINCKDNLQREFLLDFMKNNTIPLITPITYKDDFYLKKKAYHINKDIIRRKRSHSQRISGTKISNMRLILNSKKNKKELISANDINVANIIFHQIANLSISPHETFQYINSLDKSVFSHLLFPLDSSSLFHTYQCGIIFIPNFHNLTETDVIEYNGDVSESYLRFINKLGILSDITDLDNVGTDLGPIMDRTGKHGKYVLKYTDSITRIVFHVGNLLLPKIKKDIILGDSLCIAYVEKYYKNYRKIFIDETNLMIYIIVSPLSSNFYLVNIIGNKKSKEKIWKLVSQLFPLSFVIDVRRENSFVKLRRIIFEIKVLLDIDNLLKEGTNNQNCIQNDSFYNKNKGIDKRYKCIETINNKIKKIK